MTITPTKPPVTGVTARYQGSGSVNFTTTFYYWIQALYVEGWSELSVAGNTGAYCPSALSGGNFANVQWNPAPGAIGYLLFKNTTGVQPANGATGIFIATAETGFKDDGSLATFAQVPRYDGIYVAHMIYNFAVDGGAHAAVIVPAVSDTIPKGALVFGGIANGITSLAGPTDISLGTTAGSGAASILASSAIATLNAGTVVELLGNNSQAASGNKAPFKMSAAGQLDLTITVADATAGCFELFVFYVVAVN